MKGYERVRAVIIGAVVAGILAALIVLGSRNLTHFDAALVGYTFATLFAAFGIAYRYAMWLQRPPSRMYWRRGWRVLASGAFLKRFVSGVRRAVVDVAGNRFIFRRGFLRGAAHLSIMWGCILAAAITFPLVWGWIHFETVPGSLNTYRTVVFGFPASEFPLGGIISFIIFHGLVWASILVIAGVMLAFRRRMMDHGAAATQQFGEDVLPLVLLCAISITGLMLTVSYTWMRGYAYGFLAVLHAVTVILTLLWLPFGKFFHVFQRPAQLGVALYKESAEEAGRATCKRCDRPYAAAAVVRDLATVERELGFRYEIQAPSAKKDGGKNPEPAAGPSKDETQRRANHYQQICPSCRRALFGLAQSALWNPAVDSERESGAA
ncbi:MAG: hypothetical protein FWD69_03745 [Polyangiaceae bacterium]|nr:hypothetical protein [Polyangiaceae bacterium]